jgi:PBP1b-binding outer membrane lipoprotein LpoB
MLKNILRVAFISLFFIACSPPQVEEVPQSVEDVVESVDTTTVVVTPEVDM